MDDYIKIDHKKYKNPPKNTNLPIFFRGDFNDPLNIITVNFNG